MKNPKFGFEMRTYWDTFETPYQHGAQQHRLYLLNLLKEKGVESLLDVGCGTGVIFDLIVNQDEGRWDNIKKYKGVDYSPAMVGIAKEQFPHAEWEVQDARKLKEEDNSWDCVLLMHALDHLDDYKSAIKEATRVAKKYILIVLWRGFVAEGTNLNSRNDMGKKKDANGVLLEEPWEDTYLQEYSQFALEDCFRVNDLTVELTAEGETLKSDYSKYNFLYLLRVNKDDSI